MRCHNCEKEAIYLVGPEEAARIPMCLDCYSKLIETDARQNEMNERLMNLLSGYAEMTVGLPGILPRFPERRPIRVEGATFDNSVRIDRSTVGVVNTGSVATINATVTALSQSDPTAADALRALLDGVLQCSEADEQVKREMVDIVSAIATEAERPKEQRRVAVIRPLLKELAALASGVNALAQLWARYGPAIIQIFQ